jgi:hypothetical protein
MGGLHLLINTDVVSHVLQPSDIWGCDYELLTGGLACLRGFPSPRPAFNPPEIVAGCKKKSGAVPDLEFFGSGMFDEVAFWDRAVDDEQLKCMLAGYRKFMYKVLYSANAYL